MFDDAIARFQQSQLAPHLPILLGLSLLPVHVTTLTMNDRLDLLLWGNHLLLAGLWHLAESPRRQTLITLLIIGAGISALAGTWSLSVATTAWLLVLAAIITGQTLASPRKAVFRLLPALYLLTLAGYQNVEMAQDSNAALAALLVLNTLGSVAFAATLFPQAAEPKINATGVGLSQSGATALALTTFVAAALLAITAVSVEVDERPKLLIALAALLALIASLLIGGKQKPAPRLRYSREFRQWLTHTLEALSTSSDEKEFIRQSVSHLATMLKLDSVEWQIADQKGTQGVPGETEIRTESPAGYILSTSAQPATAVLEQQMLLALDLLATLAKFRQQERQLKTHNHLESIYETGARITHDVKNLLQSLNTLTTAVEHSKPEQAAAIQSLIRKQLPLIRQKLQTTLEKLDAPEDVSTTFQVARIWWEKLRVRYEANRIEFRLQLELDHLIPRDLFERVAENLLQNALRKRQSEPDIAVQIALSITEQRIFLRVTDTGSPAPPEIASLLFKGPIDSTGGYGIALYQCAMQATKQGFELALTDNDPGRVSFCLSGEIG